jgi:hypothetical protein
VLCAGLNAGLREDAKYLDDLANEIDWAISILISQKLRVSSLRNAVPAISSLPPEILNVIFHHAAHGIADDPLLTPICMSFAQVCRSWRAIALETPSLWMTPLFEWPAFADMMIRRAMDRPLEVSCYLNSMENLPPRKRDIWPALEGACRNMNNIRKLDINGPADMIARLILHSSPLPARIESLRVILRSGEAPRGYTWEGPPPSMMRNFLLGQPPSRGLPQTVHNGLGLSNLLHLTKLVVRGSRFWPGTCLNLADLLSVLARAPSLQYLELDDIYHETRFGLPAPDLNGLVPLLNLRNIGLCGSLSLSTLLLQRLGFSDTVTIDLRHDNDCTTRNDFDQVLRFLGSRTSLKSNAPFYTLSFFWTDREATITGKHIDDELEVALLDVAGGFHPNDADAVFSGMLHDVVHRSPPDSVCMISVYIEDPFECPEEHDWISAFHRLTGLRVISFDGPAALSFISALEDVLAQVRSENSLDNYTLPELETLKFRRVDMDQEIGTLRPLTDMSSQPRHAIDVLTETLLIRSHRSSHSGIDSKVRHVHLETCRMKPRPELKQRLAARTITLTEEYPDYDRKFWSREDEGERVR